MKPILSLIAFLVTLLLPAFLDAGQVRGYQRKDGTYVAPHQRSNPDSNPYNNYNFPGNYNPNTGRTTPGNPDTYLDRYNNKGRPGSDRYEPLSPYGR
jgi:hypothetical protein